MLGTERHESRRIDNQLRGRSGRQGDPGRSKFYLSLEDDLMRIFGSDRMDSVLKTLGLQEGEAITHPWMNKALEKAQQKVEARNFDIRKQILKYDDVMNDQRKVIFEQRIDIMGEDDVCETVADMRHQVVNELVRTAHSPRRLRRAVEHARRCKRGDQRHLRPRPADRRLGRRGRHRRPGDRRAPAQGGRRQGRRARRPSSAEDNFRQIEKMVLLQTLDHLWREHLVTLEHLRQVIGFRAYGQRDPLNEYKSEASCCSRPCSPTCARPSPASSCTSSSPRPRRRAALQPVELPPMQAHHIDPFTGLDELALADAAIAAEGARRRRPGARPPPAAADAQEHDGGQSDRSGHLGPRGAQRACAPAARARSTSTATARTIRAATSTA